MKLCKFIRAWFGRPCGTDLEQAIEKLMAQLDNLKTQVAATVASETAAAAALNGVGADANALADTLKTSQVALDASVAGTTTP